MIPVTYPSSVSTSKESQMVVYSLSSVAGLQRWTDYIPVKYQSTGSDVPNSFNTNGYIACDFITNLTGKQAWVDYIPVFVDNLATTAWQVSDTGFIPFNTLAGGGTYVSLDLNFLNTTALDSRITFSRGTNATLTGSNGLIQYAPHNLLTNSEDFEAAVWSKSNSSITANAAVSPDGASTADKLVENTANTTHSTSQTRTITGGLSHSISLYAKASERTRVVVGSWDGTTGMECVFNLAAGVVNSVGSYTSATMEAVGNGWYRCVATRTTAVAATTLEVVIYLDNGTSGAASLTYTGNGTSGIFIWGAQLNVGSTAQSYNSTTPKNLLGFTQEPENAAWTKSNSYVQQNLLTWSQDFDNAAWVKNNATVTANSTAAPDGTTTADTFVESTDAVPTSHFAYQSPTLAAGQSYTFTCYAKAISSTRLFQLYVRDFASTVFASSTFNLTTGTIPLVAAGTSSITNVGNGWYRLTVTGTAGAAGVGLLLLSSKDLSGLDYIGNGSSVAFIWGAQLVQGSTAGDYTQTTSAAAPTRYLNWDGTLTGRKLVEDTAAGQHLIFQNAGSQAPSVFTWSIYLKAGERTRGECRVVSLGGANGVQANFNLTTGTATLLGQFGTGFTAVSASLTNVGGGWFRFALVASTSTTTTVVGQLNLYDSAGNINYTGDGTSGIYVSDFQLSNSASVDPYVYNPQAAAASAAYYGPRFDYNPVTLASNGLLIEEQRTNLLTYSEQFDNAAWAKTNASISANTAIAPDGATTADSLIEDTSTSQHATSQIFNSGVANTTYTFSVFLKQNTRTKAQIVITDNATGETSTIADLVAGTVTAATVSGNWSAPVATIQSASNGYYRVVLTATKSAIGNTSVVPVIRLYTTSNSYTGDGTSGIFIWGAQLEAGSFATSYIPTVASQVTRNADSASMLGDNFYTWYNPNQGTTCVETSSIGANSVQFPGVLRFWSGSNNNRFGVYGKPNGAGYGAVMTTAGSNVALLDPISGSTATIINTVSKLAYAYKPDDFAATRNALTVTTDTSGGVAPVNELNIGLYDDRLNGYIRSIRYYNTRLPDSTLQAMTT